MPRSANLYVDDLSAKFASDSLVLRHGSARLVELAEAKLRGEAADPADYAAVMAGLLDQPGGERIDTVVLACTHFPLVEQEPATASPRPLPSSMAATGSRGASLI